MILPKSFLSTLPYNLVPRSPLTGEVFDRRVDTIASVPAAIPTEIEHPFQLIEAGIDEIGVRYGVVNSVVPTLGGVSLSLSPTFTLTTSGTYLCYLQAIYDDEGVISSCTINFVIGALPAYDDNNDYITIGEVDFDGTAITEVRQAATHSLLHGICGRTFDESDVIDDPGVPYFWGY